LSLYGLVWLSSRIFRVGILMYGKRPTLAEVLKWIHYV
jgi:ABC-2 type transport system permease protein